MMNGPATTSIADRSVADVMSTDLLTLKLNDTLRLADDMLNLAQVRHFPVLDGDRVAGIVNHDDLLHASMASLLRRPKDSPREALGAVAIKDIMKAATTVSPDMQIRAAAETMVERGIEVLLVVNGEKLVGLVTRTDLLRELARR
jgi:CBS domain-containing membrane protein